MDEGHAHGRAGRLELVAQRLREAAHRELGCAVGRLSGRRDDAEDAGDVDQLRCALAREHGQECARQAHGGAEVDGHQPVEVVRVHLLEQAADRDAGVVDQRGDTAVPREHGGGQRGDGGVVGHVQHMRAHADPGGPRLLGGCLEPGRVEVDQRQVHAALREIVRQRSTDAARSTGDDADAAAQRPGFQAGHAVSVHCRCGVAKVTTRVVRW